MEPDTDIKGGGPAAYRYEEQTIPLSTHLLRATPFLNEALAKAQGEFPPIPKTRNVTVKTKDGRSYQFKYADLSDVLKAITPPLVKYNLALTQPTVERKGRLWLITSLRHNPSGEVLESEMPILAPQDRPQEFGSALTYHRRYQICTLIGVSSEEDDDGNAAMGNEAKPERKQKMREPTSNSVAGKVQEPKRDINEPAFDRQPTHENDSQEPQAHSGNKKPFPPKESAKVTITEPQRARLYAITQNRLAFGWTDDAVKTFLADAYGLMSSREIGPFEYKEIVNLIETMSFEDAYKLKLKQ